MVKDGCSKKRILAEIAKCEAICKNCHRALEESIRKLEGTRHDVCKCHSVEHDKLTSYDKRRCSQLKFINKRYEWYELVKSSKKCICGESRPICLDFHHRDGTIKVKEVSTMLRRSISIIEAEMAKCDLVCANCHMKAHYDL